MLITNLFHATEVSKQFSETVVYKDHHIENKDCLIISEHSMEVYINEALAMKLVCTPSNLAELVVGRLISEGYAKSVDDMESIYICNTGKSARVFLKTSANTRLPDSQQKSNGQRLEKLQKAHWKSEWIFKLANECASGSVIYKSTQSTHACYLCVDGEIIFSAEDIGRHNALDKTIGYAAMHDINRESCILFTTGRVPTDMIKKVITARIPILVAKAVPTDAAVEMARAYDLTLICKAYPDRYEIFHKA